MLKRLPTALVLGFVLGILSGVVALVTFHRDDAIDSAIRWQLFANGMQVANDFLVVFGLYELAARAPLAARGAVRLAATLTLVTTLWYIAQPLIDMAFDHETWLFSIYRWAWVVTGAMYLVVGLAVAAAARGFSRAPLAVACLVVANIATGWIPYVMDHMQIWLWEHRDVGLAVHLAISALWAFGILWLAALIAGDGTAAVAEPPIATAGFRRIASGLKFRIVIAVILAVMGVGMLGSLGVTKVMVIGGPLVSVACMIVVAIGALAVDRATLDGMPRFRLVFGATAILWWCGVQLAQMQMGSRNWLDSQVLDVWTIGGPLIAAAGLALVGSSISKYAQARAHDALREAASVRTLLYVVLSVSSVGIQSQIEKAQSREGILMMLFVASGAAIGALVAFAGLATQAADVVESGPSLPAARITSS